MVYSAGKLVSLLATLCLLPVSVRTSSREIVYRCRTWRFWCSSLVMAVIPLGLALTKYYLDTVLDPEKFNHGSASLQEH